MNTHPMTMDATHKTQKQRLWFRLLAAAWLALAFGLGWFTPVSAQEPTPPPVSDDQVNEVAKNLYCPVCENIPLDVCPTKACSQWRELIRLKLSEGMSEDEVRQYFAEQYGDRVLSTPPAQGLNWLVYIVPPVAGVIIVGVAVRLIMNARRGNIETRKDRPSQALPESDDERYARELEELARRDE